MKRLPLLVAIALLAVPFASHVQPTNGSVQAIDKFQSGLLAQDSLTTGNYGTWFLYGDAVQQLYTVDSHPGGSGLPLTRDCTIITNGQNLLKVYLDGQVVYSSTSLNLQMPSPFDSYLEVESTYTGGMLFGIYNDYYATTTYGVQVQSAPAGDTAEIVDSSNSVLASATVGSGGTAVLDDGQYPLPIVGNRRVVHR